MRSVTYYILCIIKCMGSVSAYIYLYRYMRVQNMCYCEFVCVDEFRIRSDNSDFSSK